MSFNCFRNARLSWIGTSYCARNSFSVPSSAKTQQVSRLLDELKAEKQRNTKLAAARAAASKGDKAPALVLSNNDDEKANVQILLTRAAQAEAKGNSEAAKWNY